MFTGSDLILVVWAETFPSAFVAKDHGKQVLNLC